MGYSGSRGVSSRDLCLSLWIYIYTHMRKLLSTLAYGALLSFGFMISGCESATDAPGIDAWRNPESGTILIFRETRNRVIHGDPSSSTSSFSLEIVESGMTKWGHNNVSIGLGPDGDSLIFAVFDNGDFAIGDSGSAGVRWDVYPTGSKQTITVKDLDTVTHGTDRETYHSTRSYAGEEEIHIADRSFNTIKVIQQETQSLVSPGLWNFLTTSTDTIYFAPDLGFFIRQRGYVIDREFDSVTSTHTTALDLQAYIKK
jgi:hypothetical protein